MYWYLSTIQCVKEKMRPTLYPKEGLNFRKCTEAFGRSVELVQTGHMPWKTLTQAES